MDMIGSIFSILFGGRNVIKDTAEVFRPNAENQAERSAMYQQAALAQLAAEFQTERKGWFDRFVDGLNRLPRPTMALGVIGLFISAMWHPVWFSERMVGLQLVPDQLWWLLGAIVTFYFGARHQAKTHDIQKQMAGTLARVPTVVDTLQQLGELREETADSPGAASVETEAGVAIEVARKTSKSGDNPALTALMRGGA